MSVCIVTMAVNTSVEDQNLHEYNHKWHRTSINLFTKLTFL